MSADRIEQTRARLMRSRAEIFELIHRIAADEAADASLNAFPRSRLMRAASGKGGRLLLWGAALSVALRRPRLLWGIVRFASNLQPFALRYLAHRFLA